MAKAAKTLPPQDPLTAGRRALHKRRNAAQDGKLRVGRVLGRENDLIALDDSGTLIVNGSAQSGEILYPTYAKDTLEYPYTVPADSVFILGDYRTQSEDSRDFGPVALTDVKAKVITLLRRRSL